MPRKTQADLIDDLIHLIKEQHEQQQEVLKIALETQKAQSDMLGKWMGLFQPGTPSKSSSADERALLREQMERESEWEAIDFSGNPLMKDQN